jgi:hypothetical protein
MSDPGHSTPDSQSDQSKEAREAASPERDPKLPAGQPEQESAVPTHWPGLSPGVGQDEIMLEELRLTASHQLQSIATVGTRATTFLSILIGTFAGVIALERTFASSIPWWGAVSLIVASIILLVSLVYGWRVMFSLEAVDLGESPADVQRALAMKPETVRQELLADYSEMIKSNRAVLEDKARRFRNATYLLSAAAFTLILTSIALYLAETF